MSNILYMYHHMGMGDFILCNGIVRTYLEKYDLLYLFVKPPYLDNIKFMYRDVKNIKFLHMTDTETRQFIRTNLMHKYKIVGVRPEWFAKLNSGGFETFDEGFYIDAKVPFENKWNKFYLERDLDSEKNTFYNIIGLKEDEEYIFVHDDIKRDRIFKSKYIDKGLKIIRPADFKESGFFDFIYTIEKAEEVHVHNSSFAALIDTMQIRNDNIYFHNYCRQDMHIKNPNAKLKLNWTFLKS